MNKLEKYFFYTQELINQFAQGDLTKYEYLDKSLDAVLDLKIKPFNNVDSLDKALFNYQYYNAMAKNEKIKSDIYNDKVIKKKVMEKSNYYYTRKDNSTKKVLELLQYKGISAYFIKVNSKYLKGKLFEIVIESDDTILHSRNETILENLRSRLAFTEETKISIIDNYINQKY